MASINSGGYTLGAWVRFPLRGGCALSIEGWYIGCTSDSESDETCSTQVPSAISSPNLDVDSCTNGDFKISMGL